MLFPLAGVQLPGDKGWLWAPGLLQMLWIKDGYPLSGSDYVLPVLGAQGTGCRLKAGEI